jgi:hypothetical protein
LSKKPLPSESVSGVEGGKETRQDKMDSPGEAGLVRDFMGNTKRNAIREAKKDPVEWMQNFADSLPLLFGQMHALKKAQF